jgi:pimeloyl-ACP methyl ester carboxylesterase
MVSFRRGLCGLGIGIVLLVTGFFTWLYLGQAKYIYHPRPYPPDKAELIMRYYGASTLKYSTSQGRQEAYYFPQLAAKQPEHLWIMFGGNASLAVTNWGNLLLTLGSKKGIGANGKDAFLLMDYPGYGHCEGKPSPAAIAESADAALSELQNKLGRPLPQLRVIGHSLGAVAAMQFAAGHEIDRVILLAPFTSIHDMGKLIFHFVPSFLIRHNFDNTARLDELAGRDSPPQVLILHGASDEVIPVQMGRELAARHPSITQFRELPGINHNNILSETNVILDTMNAK